VEESFYIDVHFSKNQTAAGDDIGRDRTCPRAVWCNLLGSHHVDVSKLLILVRVNVKLSRLNNEFKLASQVAAFTFVVSECNEKVRPRANIL